MSLHGFWPVLLCITSIGLVAFLCYLGRRHRPEPSPDVLETSLRNLFRQDARVAIIVTQLSWLQDLKNSPRPRIIRTRRRMKLVLELRSRIRQYYPEASEDRVNHLSRRLLLIARLMNVKRQSKE